MEALVLVNNFILWMLWLLTASAKRSTGTLVVCPSKDETQDGGGYYRQCIACVFNGRKQMWWNVLHLMRCKIGTKESDKTGISSGNSRLKPPRE